MTRKEAEHNLLDLITKITNRYSLLSVFQDFVRISFSIFSAGTQESLYAETIKKYTPKERYNIQIAFTKLIDYCTEVPYIDLLGSVYMQIKSDKAKQKHGQFLTPPEIAEFMAKESIDAADVSKKIDNHEIVTVLDPAVGGGQMLLSFFEVARDYGFEFYHFRATGIDIDRTMCEISFVNCTMWGIPVHIIHGDTLRMKYFDAITQKDDKTKHLEVGQGDLFVQDDSQKIKEVLNPIDDDALWGHFYNLFYFDDRR